MSLGGVGREGGAGRRGIAGAAGGRVAERTVQTDPWSTGGVSDFAGGLSGDSGRRRSRRGRSEVLR